MRFVSHKNIALLVLSCALALSCDKESVSVVLRSEGDDEELCDIAFETKGDIVAASTGDYTSTTYRAQLFYRGYNVNNFPRLDSLVTPYTGTYCDPKGSNTWLTPCAVNANFEYDSTVVPAEDSSYGLRAGRYHNYYLFVSSPATAYVKYNERIKTNPSTGDPETMEYWGLPYLRGGDPKDHPAVSPAANVTTIGLTSGTAPEYGTASSTSYVYSLDSSMELIEYRSRVAFSVRCGDAISHANFKKLEITGLRKNAVLRPFTKDFFFVDDEANYEDIIVYECPDAGGIRLDRGGSDPEYTEGVSQSLTGPATAQHLDDTRTNTYFSYVLSDDYKSLDKDNKYINIPANLSMTLVSDEGNPIKLDPVPLSFIFEPQKSYFYLITINSVYLSITVVAQSWNAASTNDVSIDDPNPVTLIINISDWTTRTNSGSIEEGGGGSGGTTYDTGTGGVVPGNWNSSSGGAGTVG